MPSTTTFRSLVVGAIAASGTALITAYKKVSPYSICAP